MNRIARLALFVALLSPLSARAEVTGTPYVGSRVMIPSPGAKWAVLDHVPGAPHLLGAFVLGHGDRGHSAITFAIDERPEPSDPAGYARNMFAPLLAEPASVRILTRTAFVWRGKEGYRVDFCDASGSRHYTRLVLPEPRGGLLVLNLQSPDAKLYIEERKLLDSLLARIAWPTHNTRGSR